MGLFSKGTMEIQLKKYNYNPGEEIEGTLRVSLKKPMQGKELTISLIGKQTERYMTTSGLVSSNQRKSVGSKSSTQTVHKYKQPVSGSQEYHKNEFNFTVFIPPDILDKAAEDEHKIGEGASYNGCNKSSYRRNNTHSNTTKMDGSGTLVLPGLNLKKTQDITITKPK